MGFGLWFVSLLWATGVTLWLMGKNEESFQSDERNTNIVSLGCCLVITSCLVFVGIACLAVGFSVSIDEPLLVNAVVLFGYSVSLTLARRYRSTFAALIIEITWDFIARVTEPLQRGLRRLLILGGQSFLVLSLVLVTGVLLLGEKLTQAWRGRRLTPFP